MWRNRTQPQFIRRGKFYPWKTPFDLRQRDLSFPRYRRLNGLVFFNDPSISVSLAFSDLSFPLLRLTYPKHATRTLISEPVVFFLLLLRARYALSGKESRLRCDLEFSCHSCAHSVFLMYSLKQGLKELWNFLIGSI